MSSKFGNRNMAKKRNNTDGGKYEGEEDSDDEDEGSDYMDDGELREMYDGIDEDGKPLVLDNLSAAMSKSKSMISEVDRKNIKQELTTQALNAMF